jgi:hypothetical protein
MRATAKWATDPPADHALEMVLRVETPRGEIKNTELNLAESSQPKSQEEMRIYE